MVEPRRLIQAMVNQIPGLLEAAGAGVCSFDAKGRVIFVNRAAAMMLGYRPDEMLGKTRTELFGHVRERTTHPGSRRDEELLAIGNELPRTGEGVITRQDGKDYFIRYIGAPIVVNDRPVGSVFVFRDSSEGKKVREERDRLRDLIEETPIFVSMSDTDGNVVCFNKQGRRMLGISDGESLEGWKIAESWPFLEQAVRSGVWQGERDDFLRGWLPGDDGKGIPVLQTIVAHRDDQGDVAFFSTMAVDMSEQKRLESYLSRLAAIVEDTPDFVATCDAKGRVLYYNMAARRMLGIGEDEDISGIRVQDTHPAWARELVLGEGFVTAAREGSWKGETVLVGRDGRQTPVSQIIIAHKAENGEVEYFSTIARDMTEHKRMEKRLDRLANHDFLTGLINRARFEEKLRKELARAKEKGSSGALLLLDLDNFKGINDSLGHHAGDQVLRRVADVLRDRLGPGCLVSRFGGDEFAILLPGVTGDQAKDVGESILGALENEVVRIGHRAIGVRGSIGIALYPDDSIEADNLLITADLAMYAVKKDGGNRVSLHFADQQQRKKATLRLHWEQKIRNALTDDGFVLYRQPLLDLGTGSIQGYELLLRMKGEADQIIAPRNFLPIAERSDLIYAIDHWVIRTAVEMLAQSHGEPYTLHVNVSGKTFSDDRFLAILEENLFQSSVDPGRLVIEVTETAAIENVPKAREVIETLKQAGCRFALDDFGVGFSSFGVLRSLAVDVLKIDGSFIRNLVDDPVNRHLVRAMIEVARGLGKGTIAECVSNEETLHLLKEFGVDYGQGYYIGRPELAPIFG